MNLLTKLIIRGRERMKLDQSDIAALANVDLRFVIIAEKDACTVPLFAVFRILEILNVDQNEIQKAFIEGRRTDWGSKK